MILPVVKTFRGIGKISWGEFLCVHTYESQFFFQVWLILQMSVDSALLFFEPAGFSL